MVCFKAFPVCVPEPPIPMPFAVALPALLVGLSLLDDPPAGANGPPGEAERIRLLVEELRHTSIKSPEAIDRWASAAADLTAIGSPAVPALVAELDRTTEQMPLRGLAFTLRAIGDPRATPGLIRAIPRTLVEAGSDFGGIPAPSDELTRFLQKHDKDGGGRGFNFGRPFNELFFALHKLTGKKFHEMELAFAANPKPLDAALHMQRVQFQRLAERWATWWEEHWKEFTDDADYARVDLPPLSDPPPRRLFNAERPFPVGPGVTSGGRYSGSSVGPATDGYSWTFYDLDTDRQGKWPRHLGAQDDAEESEVLKWAAAEGFDLWGARRETEDGRGYHVLHGIGLSAWRVAPVEFGEVVGDLRRGAPPLDRPAGPLLADFHPDREPPAEAPDSAGPPRADATYLFLTREGSPGILRIAGHITRLHRGGGLATTGARREEEVSGFYLGVEFDHALLADRAMPADEE